MNSNRYGPRRDRAVILSGSLVVVLLAAGLTMALLARSGTTVGDLGLAVFGGAVVGGVFVVIEYQLNLASQRRHDHESVIFQLTTTSDLAGIDLSGRDLSGVYLPGKNLVAARLDGANLTEAQMYFADLRHASLRSVSARGCDLGGSILDEADMEGADLAFVDFYDSNVRNAVLRNADLSATVIVNADFSGSDLRSATLVNATIRNTVLMGTDLTDADLSDATLEQIQYDSSTAWPVGFSPPASSPVEDDWIEGTKLADWLSLRRADTDHSVGRGVLSKPIADTGT